MPRADIIELNYPSIADASDPVALKQYLIDLESTIRTLQTQIINHLPMYGALQYAGIHFDGGIGSAGSFNVVTADDGVDNKVQIVGFDTNGDFNGAIPDHTEDHITIKRSGEYACFIDCSASSGNNNDYEVVVYTNNGTVDTAIHAHRSVQASGSVGDFSASFPIDLSIDDTVEAWLIRLTGGAVSRTLTFEHIVLWLFQLSA